jgi:hypothetical protein
MSFEDQGYPDQHGASALCGTRPIAMVIIFGVDEGEYPLGGASE